MSTVAQTHVSDKTYVFSVG